MKLFKKGAQRTLARQVSIEWVACDNVSKGYHGLLYVKVLCYMSGTMQSYEGTMEYFSVLFHVLAKG